MRKPSDNHASAVSGKSVRFELAEDKALEAISKAENNALKRQPLDSVRDTDAVGYNEGSDDNYEDNSDN